jgi:POT family proton-dependent oligopeptide transporter
MFKGQPNGLFIHGLANLGERFGYYTMIALFVLFLQANYGYSESRAGEIYATFLLFVYFLPLLGGIVADRWLGYRKTVALGLVVLFVGYLLLAFPRILAVGEQAAIYTGLGTIALGTGLFKGNLQALVGKLYDQPGYEDKRDSGFSIFYMFINLGAMFAPTAAQSIVNGVMHKAGLSYDSRIPELFHKWHSGEGITSTAKNELLQLVHQQDPSVTLNQLSSFGGHYIDVLGQAYRWGFALACVSMLCSLILFILGQKWVDAKASRKSTPVTATKVTVTASSADDKERVLALGLVFAAVIFFWMAFHQNGLTLTYFARDYTQTSVGRWTNCWFDLPTLLLLTGSVGCAWAALFKAYPSAKNRARQRITWGTGAIVLGALVGLRVNSFARETPFTPQLFQHFNPFFIVVLTPVAVALFGQLAKKGKEPSAPRKIAYGMLIAGGAYLIMSLASVGLLSPMDRGDAIDYHRVSPYWLMGTYFTLTVAELFISPMGISFVSKVAPARWKGLMQGGWFAATALGNYLIQVGSHFWNRMPLWSLWCIFVCCCFLSAAFMFSILRKLEKATK